MVKRAFNWSISSIDLDVRQEQACSFSKESTQHCFKELTCLE